MSAVQPTFTVSATAVILNNRNEVLLLDHVLRPASGWGPPGGFLRSGEQPDAAIRREVREETGLELDSLRLIRGRTFGSHLELVYSATTATDPEIRSREIYDFGWFAADSLPAGMTVAQASIILDVLKTQS